MNRVLYLRGMALCSPEAPASVAAELLPARMRGRASMLTRMIVEVVSGAARQANVVVAAVPLIVGSAYGEIATMAQLLAMMVQDDGALSPARFQASVHNSAAGQISIATGNQLFSTCLAAGDATCAAVLIEASAWLATHGGDVIATVADEALPGLFAIADRPYPPLAMALLLSAEASAPVLATLGPLSHDPSPDAAPARPAGDDPRAHSPVAPWLAVLDAVAAQRSERVVLPGIQGSWRFELNPGRVES